MVKTTLFRSGSALTVCLALALLPVTGCAPAIPRKTAPAKDAPGISASASCANFLNCTAAAYERTGKVSDQIRLYSEAIAAWTTADGAKNLSLAYANRGISLYASSKSGD